MAAEEDSFIPHRLICQICTKPFSDPRTLPCLHSFCCQCLDHEVEKVAPLKSIQCPMCLRSVAIPEGGASVLPQNLHLGSEREIAEYISKFVSDCQVPCTFCVNGCTDTAVAFCYSCCQFMCAFGELSHKRLSHLYHHSTVQLDQEVAAQIPTAMKQTDRYCPKPKHKKQELDFYCNTCSSVVCILCTVVLHKGHNITELSTIAENHREEMREAQHSAQEFMSKLARAIDANDKMIQQVEDSQQEVELAIEHTFTQLMRTLEARKTALLSELKVMSLTKTTPLLHRKEQFEEIQQEICRYSAMNSDILQTHTDHEIVALKKVVHTELNTILKENETAFTTPNQYCCFVFSAPKDEALSELSKFGNVVDLLPAPHTSKCTFESVAEVNMQFLAKVETMSSNGEMYPCGGLQVEAELRPKSHDGPVVPGEVEDHVDGTYTISLTPQTAGPHQLHVTMDGQHVQKSPYDLEVMHDYRLSDPQQEINVSGNPYCVSIHENGDIYVSCSDHCICVFDQDGHPKDKIGSRESGNGQFNGPGIFVKEDVIYVTDYYNHCVQKLTTGGMFLIEFGENGSDEGQFNGPWDVIVDRSERVIISDSENNRVQVFDQNGNWLSTIDGNGSGDCTFSDPRGLALDSAGNIHVAANASNAIKVFTREGAFIRMYGEVNGPVGIKVNEQGYSFVSERGGNCVSIFDPQGHKIHAVEKLNNPCGVALDTKGDSVYVANCGGKSVLKYTL